MEDLDREHPENSLIYPILHHSVYQWFNVMI
jgi:hypothetical protein